jgi:hypothetical protein
MMEVVFALALMTLSIQTEAAPGSPAAQIQAFQSAEWKTTLSLADLPASLLAELHARVAARIADHGQSFNPTDVGMPGEDAPRVRLVLSGHSVGRWFVCLEVGGVAHALYFTIFEVKNQSASLVAFAVGSAAHADTPRGWEVTVDALKTALRERRLAPVDPARYLLKD